MFLFQSVVKGVKGKVKITLKQTFKQKGEKKPKKQFWNQRLFLSFPRVFFLSKKKTQFTNRKGRFTYNFEFIFTNKMVHDVEKQNSSMWSVNKTEL